MRLRREPRNRAPTPCWLVISPKQHAGDGEVGETADALRHQLQLRFRHSRVHEKGRRDVSRLGSYQSGNKGGASLVGGASGAGRP